MERARTHNQPVRPPVDPRWVKTFTVLTLVAWPVAMLVYLSTGFASWWVILVPIMVSIVLANLMQPGRSPRFGLV